MNSYRLQSVLRLHVKVILASLFLLSGLIACSTHAATANLSISADNANEVYLNGVLLGTGNNWAQASNYSVAVQSGANVLAVKGIDTGGIAGLIAELSWPGGSAISNASWKVSTTAPAGWQTVGFNDSAWVAATSYGQYGVSPWFKNSVGFPANSTAQWIWSADANNDNTVYLRYTFSVAGTANVAPTISLTSPANNSSVSAPANLTLNANAADSDGTISKVEFYNGATLLNTDTTAPYSYSLNATAGSYTLTAKATDNLGASTTSAVVNVTVNAATANLSISADNANEVYLNGVLLGSGNDWTRASNYSLAVQSGANVLAVKGIDTGGIAGLIAELSWPGGSAISNASWKVSTTAPAGWQTVGFNDSAWPTATSYGQYGVSPWFKNSVGFPTNSTAQWIWSADANNDNTVYLRYTFSVATVNPPPTASSVYYIFADHLNTPRVITDTANKTVWRWDADPFGTDVASEDPDGDGRRFTYNHRFPGQYFDKETSLHYNYFRDYDPSTGRYLQSDPIGLEGGINTFGYVGGNPLTRSDPLGLIFPIDFYECIKARNEIEEAQKECKNEYAQCKTDKEQIEFLEKYGGGFESTAMFSCAQKKKPAAWKKLVNSCGRAGANPKGPWPLKPSPQ